MTAQTDFMLFDKAGQAFQPVRNFNRTSGVSAYRLQRPGTSNRTEDAEEVVELIEVARVMLKGGRLARIKAANGEGQVNYLGYGKQKLVAYELSKDFAEKLGLPQRGNAGDEAAHDATLLSKIEDDEALLARFDTHEAFRKVRTRWSSHQTAMFCQSARSVHEAGLDWWPIKIASWPFRFGRKRISDVDGYPVLAYLGVANGLPRIEWARKTATADLNLPDDLTLTAQGVDVLDAFLEQNRAQLESWFSPSPPRPGYWPDQYLQPQIVPNESTPVPRSPLATNLILYGPPGTGKTYTTALEAVRLCSEPLLDSASRAEVMDAYNRLLAAGRIEFVTFHQNYGYEDFVEGLRPQTGEDSAGFRLVPEAGIFRRIAHRAQTSTGSGGEPFALGARRLFKMSIGRATEADDAYLFDEAIRENDVILGYDDLDWTDHLYADPKAILKRVRAEGVDSAKASLLSGSVQSPNIFRNWVRAGDLILVSKGNSLVRAIAEVEGDYRFEPRLEGDYAHRRTVKWLWQDRQGAAVSDFYASKFMMKSIYQLTTSDLNVPALERYINSQRPSGPPEQFVLVIDEINRANVSKVFGELITLLETDKRLGQENALTVRLPFSPEPFGVPSNLHILGTMNTADRSIALLDTALRRRFRFKELAPRPGLLAPVEGIDLPAFLTAINRGIEYLLDREHRIGHAFLMRCTTKDDVDRVMRDQIIPLLQEYFFEDWGRVAAVLGEPKGGGFLQRAMLIDPMGIGAQRPSWEVRERFELEAYYRCIKGTSATDDDIDAAP